MVTVDSSYRGCLVDTLTELSAMKRFVWALIIFIPVFLGIVIGGAMGWWSVKHKPWPGYPVLAEAQPAQLGSSSGGDQEPSEPQPKIEVPEDTYDFGRIESNSVVRHEFTVKNVGQALLRITIGDSSCRCTVLNLDSADIPPGESRPVAVEFNGKDYFGPVTQRATILTNDPKRPQVTFTVKADVVKSIRVVPSEIIFSRVVKMQPAVGEAKIYVFRDQPVRVTGIEFAHKDDSAQFIDLDIQPLSPEELKVEPGAKAGYRVTVRLKPGLPLGPIQQKIRVLTDQKDMPELEIALAGRVESDVNIVGAGWDAARGILHLGRINQSTGAERRVMLRLTPLVGESLKVEVERTVPDFLQVMIEEPREVEASLSLFVPITVRVPPGVGPANYFGLDEAQLGKVILKTNHPDAPEVKILVRFAVD